jgi:hypothetical protein
MKTFFKLRTFLMLCFLFTAQLFYAQQYNTSNGNQNMDKNKKQENTPPPPPKDNPLPENPNSSKVPSTGCGSIWNHLVSWQGKNSESPGAEISFEWYDAPANDDGSSVIVDPVFPGNDDVIAVVDPVKIKKSSVNEDSPDIKFSQGDIDVERSKNKDIAALLKLKKVAIDAKTNRAAIKDPKGPSIAEIQFFDANKKGEMWGRCKYNKKKYYVKMKWTMGKFEGNNFEAIKK